LHCSATVALAVPGIGALARIGPLRRALDIEPSEALKGDM